MKVTEMRFVTREEATGSDKGPIFDATRAIGGVIKLSRRDADGGELIEFKVGKGKNVVKILWSHWIPHEQPALFVGSNSKDALAATISALLFNDQFFHGLSEVDGSKDPPPRRFEE